MLIHLSKVKSAWLTYNTNPLVNSRLILCVHYVFVKEVVIVNFIAIGLFFQGYICVTKHENGYDVDWLVLSVVFLALFLASSLDKASTPSVVDAEVCESFEPKYGGSLLHHVFQTLKVPSSIYCLRACDDDIRCQSINRLVHGEIRELNNRTREAKREDFTDDHTKVYMNKFRKRG